MREREGSFYSDGGVVVRILALLYRVTQYILIKYVHIFSVIFTIFLCLRDLFRFLIMPVDEKGCMSELDQIILRFGSSSSD